MTIRKLLPGLILTASLAACGQPFPGGSPLPGSALAYGARRDGDRVVPAVPAQYLSMSKVRREVTYWSREKPGTIIVDPGAFHLYYILGGNKAMRYTVSVGKAGYGFTGTATIAVKREWPRWTPTANQLRRTPELDMPWRHGMPGGLENPLGARALYLYRDGRDTLYRIHGTPYPESIGHSDTDGCIRLFQQDIINLYARARTGAKVIVLRPDQTDLGTYPPGTPVPASVKADRKAAAAARARAEAE